MYNVKHNGKKLISILLLFTFVMMSLPVFAENPAEVTMTAIGDTVEMGKTVTAKVKLDSKVTVAGISFKLTYDPAILQIEDIGETEVTDYPVADEFDTPDVPNSVNSADITLLNGMDTFKGFKVNNYDLTETDTATGTTKKTISIAMAGTDANEIGKLLMTVKFKAVAVGTSPLTFSGAKLIEIIDTEDGRKSNSLNLTTTDGSVQVVEPGTIPEAPAAVESARKGTTYIKINPAEKDQEYKLILRDEDGEEEIIYNWTKPATTDDETYTIIFENLDSDTTYEVYTRYAATETTPASYASEPLDVTTNKEPSGNRPGGPVHTATPKPTLPPTPGYELTDKHIAYVQGDDNGLFNPDNPITRAEAATIFARLTVNKSDVTSSFVNRFSDVKADDWFAEAVSYMARVGIVNGYEDGTFKPNDYITRAEFATMAARYDELDESATSKFSDIPNNHWAVKYIDSAANKGWVNGYEDGTFKPDQTITRAETVTVVNRMTNRTADESFINKNLSSMVTFKDVAKSHWAYLNILEAANAHMTDEESQDKEVWTKLGIDE